MLEWGTFWICALYCLMLYVVQPKQVGLGRRYQRFITSIGLVAVYAAPVSKAISLVVTIVAIPLAVVIGIAALAPRRRQMARQYARALEDPTVYHPLAEAGRRHAREMLEAGCGDAKKDPPPNQ